ncbi:MAG: PilZ domain-containing protein [Acidobacteriota bacterium]|nr:PilZ domain-containing protein [Acidobacteriota bacterium]
MPTDSPPDGHRIYPQVPVSGRASIRVVGQGDEQSRRVVDLSRSGALIETEPMPIGARVRASFLGLQVRAQVVSSGHVIGESRSAEIAIRFDDLQEPHWKTLRIRRD